MNRLLDRLWHIFQWRLRYEEAKAFVLFSLSRLLVYGCKKEKDLWLFAERGTDARDNGYWMFRYVMENHPEVNAKFIISKDSEDRHKLVQWESRLIPFGSFRHYLMIWKATCSVSTHVGGYLPYYIREVPSFRHLYHRWASHIRLVWLQHGVIMNDMPQYHYHRTHLDLLVCGARPEYDFISKTFGYPQGVVRYLGLARYDQLSGMSVKRRQILLMPTWRQWLLNKEAFSSSKYLRTFASLLADGRLHRLLQENGLTLVFYPHYEVQPYIHEFRKSPLPDCISIADKAHYDVQTLLKESALLITDYSSVALDFAYMRKPLVYFQFDEEEFWRGHYRRGYYDYHNGLGGWCSTITDLLVILECSIHQSFRMDEAYRKRAEDFFPLSDTHNRERNFQAIKQIL